MLPKGYSRNRLALVTPPVGYPVTLDEAKAHLRVDTDLENGLIESLIATATQFLDGYAGVLGRAILDQTYSLTIHYDDMPSGSGRVYLPIGGAKSLTSVSYYNGANSQVVRATDVADYFDFLADGWWSYVEPKGSLTWPSVYDRADAMSITWLAGYGAAADVPAPIKQAILLLVGHFYENREAVTERLLSEVPMTVRYLIAPYRAVNV
jgi:uncharacterized phiE125 gp8 family phage protein